MDGSVILMCKRGELSAGVVLSRRATYQDLVEKLCRKWSDLKGGALLLLYSLEGHAKCMLSCDDDLEALFALTLSRRIDAIDVILMDSGSSSTCSTVDPCSSDGGSIAGRGELTVVDDLFNELLAELEREGGDKMRDFLSDLDVKHWAHAHFPGHRYGELSSNLAECFNRWIKDERCLPVTQLVDAIRMKLMEQMSRRKEESWRWKTTVCPTWDKRLAGLFQFSRTWVVRKSSADVYDVRGNPSNTVNIRQRRCTCKEWQLNCFPCVHAVCAIRKSGCDLNDFVEPCYLVYSFREAYSKSIEPIPTVYKPDFVVDSDDVILPPLQRRPAGRPRTERVSPIWKTTRKRLCSRCGTVARHNKRTCKEPLLS
ncbi:hypothetical protein RHMOL_Rhmol07G0142500 [Rhododendron molle]|nr:hypothetical protein RHMOL_Rhmol12G0249800 [Rhododendron molle]KAI8546726.1 hypothetical protein RHMOL_Rhmol07G0142500 [Rhododendron molle]